MNDFTKTELKDILWHLVNPISLPPGNLIVPRLQDMIEKYCEHKDTYCCDYCGLVGCEDCKESCGGELIDE